MVYSVGSWKLKHVEIRMTHHHKEISFSCFNIRWTLFFLVRGIIDV